MTWSAADKVVCDQGAPSVDSGSVGMIELRGGNTTEDRRLDRLVSFDERSRRYPIRSIVPEIGPKRGRTWFCDTVLDQGAEGACVGFACSHELICQPQVCKSVDGKFARERIYFEAQKEDEWEGGAYPGARPFYEGTSVLAGVKQLKKLGLIDEYRWAFSLEELIRGLYYEGPAILGVNWYEGMSETDRNGHIHKRGELRGGHAILARGFSKVYRRVKLHNSWGRSWGVDGWCWISFDDLAALLAENGEVCFPIGRKAVDVASLG